MPKNSPAETVLVDMDGVLADFETANNDMLRANGIEPVQDRQDFYYKDTYRDQPDVCNLIYRENRRPGFFRNFPLVENAREGWMDILDAGFMPIVCSSPLENHPTVVEEKKAWLKEHFVPMFGSWVVETAIFDRDKSGYFACAAIDDRPALRRALEARWQHIVFSKSYNLLVRTDFRLNGWNDHNLWPLLQCARKKYLSTYNGC